VSTAGVVPRILELARFPIGHISRSRWLRTDDDLRNELMPINKRWPLEDLLSACKVFEKTLKPASAHF
jgi:23S rRNA (adenine2503-C2)-methyltransferase